VPGGGDVWVLGGAHNLKRATTMYLCHGFLADHFIFRLNFQQIQTQRSLELLIVSNCYFGHRPILQFCAQRPSL